MRKSLSMIYKSWIIVVETINVCPDLYLGCIYSSTNNCSRVITASALKGINILISIYSYKSLCNIYFGSYFPF